MNMKKILASVAASALAVTSLAAVASAKDISLNEKGKDTYHATVTGTTSSTDSLSGGEIVFKWSDVTPPAGTSVEKITITLTVFDENKAQLPSIKKESTSLTKGDIKFTYSTTASFAADFANVLEAGGYKADVVVDLVSDNKIENADVCDLGLIKDKLVANPTPTTSVGNITTGSAFIIPGLDEYALKDVNEKGGTVKVTFSANDQMGANEAKKVSIKVTLGSADGKVLGTNDTYIEAGQKNVPLSVTFSKYVEADRGGNVKYNQDIYVLITSDAKVDVNTATFTYTDSLSEGDDDDDKQGGVEADDDDDDDTTTTPPTTTPATGNGSGNAGSDPNPGTGVALAVIPAIVAASGVIVFKKRK